MSNLLQKRKMYCIRIIHMKEPPHKDRPFCDKGNNKKSVAKRWKTVSFHKRHQKSESPDQHNMNVQYYYQNDRKITTWITVSSIKMCTIWAYLQGIYFLNKNDICSITYTHVGISPDFLLTLHLDPFHEFDSEYVLRRLILRTSPSIDRRHQT